VLGRCSRGRPGSPGLRRRDERSHQRPRGGDLARLSHLLTDEDHEQRHPAQGEGRWGEAMRHEQYLRAGKGK